QTSSSARSAGHGLPRRGAPVRWPPANRLIVPRLLAGSAWAVCPAAASAPAVRPGTHAQAKRGFVFSGRTFVEAEREPRTGLEFPELRRSARGNHEHEYRPWFALCCEGGRTCRAGCAANQNQANVSALTREA